MEENNLGNVNVQVKDNKAAQIGGAIVIAGIIIAGAILLQGNMRPPQNTTGENVVAGTEVKPTATGDQLMGNPDAEVSLILYEDFQCPFCGKFYKESETQIRESYVKNGSVNIIYRDFAFLGEESLKAAEAARCAGDQGKFWEYHDYLYTHQNGENGGAFANVHLKSFARTLGFDEGAFNQCLDSGKYTQAVIVAKNEASLVGVNGTPKGFILKDGKVVDTIDGAIPYIMVQQKIDAALK